MFKNSVFGCFLRADLEIDFEKALGDAIVTLSIVDWDETKQNQTLCIKYGINDELDALKRRYASYSKPFFLNNLILNGILFRYEALEDYLTITGKEMVFLRSCTNI
jgi:hypothetical protein